MKIRVTLDSNDVTNITLHSYQQRINSQATFVVQGAC